MNLQGSSINLQGGDIPLQGSQPAPQVSLPSIQAKPVQQSPVSIQPPQQPQQQLQQQPSPTPVVTNKATIPQYLTKDETRLLLQRAQVNKIDPAVALKALVDQGHIIEGINDQNYTPQNNANSQNQPSSDNQKHGFAGIVQNIVQGITKPFTRAGVEVYNVGAAANKAFQGDISGANAELNKSRNLGYLGETQPTLTESYRPGMRQALDVAGQGIELGTDVAGLGAGGSLIKNAGEQGIKQLVKTGVKEGTLYGASAGFGGSLQGQNQSFLKSLKQTAGGAVGGALLGGLTGGITGVVKKLPWDSDPVTAANSFEKLYNVVTGDKTAAGQKFAQDGINLTEANPDLKLKLDSKQLYTLQEFVDKKLVNVPSLGSHGELNPSQTQNLLTELDSYWNPNDPTNLVYGFGREIKKAASEAFDKPTNGAWNKIYQDYSSKINTVKTIGNMLVDPKTATPEQITTAQKGLAGLMQDPVGKVNLKNTLQQYLDVLGHDLAKPVDMISRIHGIKNPQVQTNLKKILTNLGWLAAGSLGLGGVGQKIKGLFGG